MSELTNDKGYLTEHQSLNAYATTEWVKGQNYLTTHQDISMKAEQTALNKYMRWTIASLIIGGLSLLGVVAMFLKLFFDIF